MTRNGFTLVEMLVSVAIFSLIAAAGVTLLSVSVSAQQTAERKLKDVASVRRASALIAADLANAAARLRRDENGSTRPAFEATSDGFSLVRHGWENPDGEARPSLQRIDYRLVDRGLDRHASAFVDGSTSDRRTTLLDAVTRFSLRFRAANGEWRERWDPVNPRDLPRALELVADTEEYGTLRQLFLVGAGR